MQQAETVGLAAFNQHVAPATGDSTFLERQMRDSTYTLAPFDFSANLDFSGPVPTNATFVLATVTEFTMDTWLGNIIPGAEQDIGGTAVAGPAPIDPANICDTAARDVCANNRHGLLRRRVLWMAR